ncbi:alpha-L-glutamate ligase [Sulfurimonas crateris]|uniref:Alpha-L-glutamate ligase n=1 Tax=Sulfurimonas crateris TaxID=2574727 RepID=A0A4U2ZDG7_9BACT|nr:alpha-L-glutamate ligase [Sulfurimonas crateris]TKI71291.1 alpha-L-glutamate ligase [Sulfurimonas crateris]
MQKKQKLPKVGFLYLDYVLRFFDYSNFKGWPDKIEAVTYHWKNDKERFIKEVKQKKIDVLVGNIPATAYETFKEIAKELPHVRFIPSIETQFCNKSKENVTLFCEKYNIQAPKTIITYDEKEADEHFKGCHYPQIIKRSYGPSNYGGYFVHKVDNYKEAKALLAEKKYKPIYSQDGIPLKDSGDIRVMLIGHKPICAFWRYSGDGEWITNTSQGGSMSYENVPMSVLELAVKASKAAKAEYWACDIAIDENTDEPYILECATAFAAFPYVRDWIGQYIMWDLSGGKFRLPHIPLFSWEELGKMDASVLRTLRHLYFAKYEPSADGAYWLADKGNFGMEQTDESNPSDVPASIEPPLKEENLPDMVKGESETASSKISETKLYNVEDVSLTELMTLQGMEEDIAVNIKELVDTKEISSFKKLSEYFTDSKEKIEHWAKSFIK